mgnify:CR=1 FL=1
MIYNKILILSGIFLAVLFILAIVLGDPLIIIFGIIIGVCFLFIIIAVILEWLFPKNKLSKKLEKIPDWILDNIKF